MQRQHRSTASSVRGMDDEFFLFRFYNSTPTTPRYEIGQPLPTRINRTEPSNYKRDYQVEPHHK